MEGKTIEVVHHKDKFSEMLKNASEAVANEFINGGHLLGVTTGFIALAVMVIFDFTIRWEIFLLAYLLTQTVYGFDYYHDLQKNIANDTPRVKYVQRTKKIYPNRLATFAGSFLLLLVYIGNLPTIIMGSSILVLGISYSLWFKNMTKSIVGFKNIYVAFTFSLAIVFITLFYSNVLPIELLFFTMYTAISVFMNCSFCDIKDMKSDTQQGLKTLPLVLGKQRFFMLLIIMNAIMVSILVYLVCVKVIPFYFVSLFSFNILWFIVIHKGMRPNIDYHQFSSRILNSMEIFMFIFLFAGKIIISIHML
jgi:hypothetical protein